jgi:phosphoglycerate dehydrogenase-like enzyme
MLAQHATNRGLDVRFARINPDGTAIDDLAAVQAVFFTGLSIPVLRQLLRDHPAIRWVAAQNAGIDALMVPEIVERGIAVTRVRHVHDTYVGEFAMTCLLALAKGLPEIVRANERHEWLEFQPARVSGQTVVVVGYGEIGRAVARRARGFDMRVLGVRAHPQPDDLANDVWGADRLDDALAEADHVVVVLPGGAGRRHLIAEPQLRRLRKHAFLVNVGRGETVDYDALDRVLREEGFAGALLDVFEQEPLPKESPLWSNPRVLVSGHLAGIRSGTPSEAVLDQLVDNMARFTRGEPLLNTVDVTRGY